MAEDSLANRFALPVGNHLACVDRNILSTDGIALLITGIEDMEIFDTVAGQFRKGRHSLRLRATLGDDQLVITDIQSFFLAVVEKIKRPQHRDRALAVILLVESRLVQSALYRKARLRLHAQFAQALNALIHARPYSSLIHRVKVTLGGGFPLRH